MIPTSLFIAVPLVNSCGNRMALVVGMSMYVVYAILFTIACILRETPTLASVLYGAGSSFAGFAAGVLWTAQGGWFARTRELLGGQDEDRRREEGIKLSASWAFWYLLLEFLAKLGVSLLQLRNLAVPVISGGYAAIGLFSAAMMMSATSPPIDPQHSLEERSILEKK
jgi:hypothetical protein